MGHRAGRDFFDRKREWSKRKDRVLESYLVEYVPTVAHALKRPVCVVDGFAGPGEFKDGEPGSPRIIRRVIGDAKLPPGVTAHALFIEKDEDLHAELAARFAADSLVEIEEGEFLAHAARVEELADRETLFLYLDPYTVEGLQWEVLDRIFRRLDQGKSVEVLLNFNADSFARRGLSALKLAGVAPDADPEDPDQDDSAPPVIEHLDSIVGGDWWREALRREAPYPELVRDIIGGFCDRLRRRFPRVCVHEIEASVESRVPKYALIFGSRSPTAVLIMNDAMVASREMLVEASEPTDPTLFELRPEKVVPSAGRLTELVLEEAATRMTRLDLMDAVARRAIGLWKRTEIRGEIERLLGSGHLRSATGKSRINDSVAVWRS